MSISLETLALSKSYTKKSIIGLGAIKGANCQISQIRDNGDGTHTITFLWKDINDVSHTSELTVKDGETPVITTQAVTGGHKVTFTTTDPAQSETFNVMDGISVTDVEVTTTNHLIVTLSSGATVDAGEITVVNELSSMDDVALTTLSDGDSLVYDSTSGKWINKELSYEYSVEDLIDVDIDTSTLADGDIIKWDATNSKWVKGQIPTIESLDDIGDVTLTALANGQIIKYDAVLGKWVNEDNEVVADLDDLQDVVIDTATLENGQILKYDSVRNVWYNGSATAVSTKVEDLEDVSIDPLTFEDGQVLVWDATNEVWVNKNNGANIQKLDDIGDVELTSLVDGQIIVWDATAQKWINAELITTLENLSDVRLTNLQNADILRYDSITSKWYNTVTDTVVTENSTNLVSSGAVFTAIKAVDDKIGALASLKTTNKTTVVNAMNEVFDSLADLIVKVGDLTLLTTTDKTTIVNAINEIVANVGDLTTLTTTDKTSIVNAINEVLATVKALKYLEQLSTMGEASDYPNRIVNYVGATTADYTRGYVYRSTPSVIEGEVVYTWVRIDVQPNNDDYETLNNKPQINDVELVGNKSLDDLGIQKIMQYTVMPTPSVDWVGNNCIQYLGNTTDTLKTGYFYVCKYVTEDAEYKWVNIDVSSNAELAQRVTTLETNQGDMTLLEVAGANDIVTALNKLNVRGIKSITYAEPYLTILLQDDTSFQFDLTVILQSTDIGELGNVIDTTIQNGNLLQYDSSILKYKPYDVATALSNLLQESKDYTDEQIASAVQDDAYITDEKPNCTLDSSTGQYIVVYYQNSVLKTTTAISSRFYYKDSEGDPYCTSWFVTGDPNVDPVDFTYLISSPDFDDYINRNTDVVHTYNTEMVDKTKIPDIAAIDALYEIIATALGLKVNTADVVDALNSEATDVPLSAHQGKVLKGLIDEKQDIMQMSTMPVCDASYVDVIYQYVGSTSSAYTQGRFYIGTHDTETDVYAWKEVKFSADYDSQVLENSTNAPQGGAVYDELQLKQDKNLETPIVVEGTQELTVETALNELNTAKAKKFQVTTMPTASIDNLGLVVQYVSATTSSYTEGYFYKCKYVDDTYVWEALTSKIDVDSTLSNTSTNPAENQAITNSIQALQNGVIIVYPTEADRLDELSFETGQIVTIGTICYCVSEESWYRVTAINASSLEITWTAYDPKIATDTDVEKRLEKVTALPTASADTVGKIYLLTNAQANYQLGGIYKGVSSGDPVEYSWELISISPLTFDSDDFTVTNDNVALNPNQRIFKGSHTQWNTLTLEQKAKYTIVIFNDDNISGEGDVRKQPKLLETPLTIGGTEYTTVESALAKIVAVINNNAYWNGGN